MNPVELKLYELGYDVADMSRYEVHCLKSDLKYSLEATEELLGNVITMAEYGVYTRRICELSDAIELLEAYYEDAWLRAYPD